MAEAVKAELPPRQYEVVYILRPDIDKETSERVAKRIADVITRENGTLTLVETWGRRRLSYEIEHYKRGIYVYNVFLGNGALVAELERNFRLLDEVIRFQTVKLSDDPGQVEVDAELIKFEAAEGSHEDDEDQTLEQELGLVQAPRAPRPEAREESEGADAEGSGEAAEAGESSEAAPAPEAAEASGDSEAKKASSDTEEKKASSDSEEEKSEGADS